jgi:hypothetical protein
MRNILIVFVAFLALALAACSPTVTPTAAVVAAPTFSPAPGALASGGSVMLAAPDGDIYYTLDGSAPSSASARYSAPIKPAPGATVIQAIAVKDGVASAVVSGAYTVPNVFVHNSKWETVGEYYVSTRARDLTSDAAARDLVAAHNASTLADRYFLLEGADVAIEDAPPCNIYVVNPSTVAIIDQALAVPRVDAIANIDFYVHAAQIENGTLYVDNIPPPPPPVIDTRTDYEKYAIYIVAASGAIVYETHCEDWDLYAPTIAGCYTTRLYYYNLQAMADGGGEYVITGRIYTAP